MPTKLPVNQSSAVSPARAMQEIQSRFNPLRGFTPQRVVRLLEEFDRGLLRECAWMMDKVEQVDDMTKTVASKRKKAPSRLAWDIRPYERWEEFGSEKQLQDQTEFLRHLYNSLVATHALERNLRGGLRTLIYQMADAIGKRYAAHEIAWRPRKDGLMEATLTFVPLWFFENTSGLLRFLPAGGTSQGEEIDPLSWMVTIGEGLMVATLTAYTYKTLPIKDWLTYSERCGMPFPSMATDAAPGSKEWDDAVEAVAAVAAEFGAVHSRNAEFQVHDLTAKGALPHPPLVERMDRAIAMLWRGADLSTMSGAEQMGASLQQGESDILIEDDVDMVNETLEQSLSLPALRWRFGADVRPLCFFALSAPDRLDEKAEQEKLHAAADYGVPIPVSDYRERLNIPGDEDDEEDAVLVPPEKAAAAAPTDFANAAAGQSRLVQDALADALDVAPDWLAPLGPFLDRLAARGDGPMQAADLAEIERMVQEELPELLDQVEPEALAAIIEEALARAVVESLNDPSSSTQAEA